MKIFYFFFWNDGIESGVIKKIGYQVKSWERLGHEVLVNILTQENSALYKDHQQVEDLFFKKWTILPYSGFVSRAKQAKQLLINADNFKPDVVYLRKCKYTPAIAKLLERYPSVMELNGMPKPFRYRIGHIFDRTTIRLLVTKLNGFIAVANEISKAEIYKNTKLPCQVIGNSINLEDFENLPIKNNDNNPILVYIGTSNQYWQGVDKILRFANLKPEWKFHIVGSNRDEFSNIIIDHENVMFHGKLSKIEYRKIFEESDVAIGSLARHRRGMNETSTLKVREYLAFGLPVIMAHEDPDFAGNELYIKILPNNENCLIDNHEEINSFVLKWKGKRVPKKIISHLDTSVKEKKRIDFFNKVINIYKNDS